MNSPLSRYRQDLEREDFTYDPSQEEAVAALDDVFHQLVSRSNNEKNLTPGERKLLNNLNTKANLILEFGNVL